MDPNVDEILIAIERGRQRRTTLDQRCVLAGMRDHILNVCTALGYAGAVDACYEAIDMLLSGDFDEQDFADREILDTLERTICGMRNKVATATVAAFDDTVNKNRNRYPKFVKDQFDRMQSQMIQGMHEVIAGSLAGRTPS